MSVAGRRHDRHEVFETLAPCRPERGGIIVGGMDRRLLTLLFVATVGCASGDAGSPDGGSAPGDGGGGADAPFVSSQVLYLNFDGQALAPGPDDATTNTSGALLSSQTMTPFWDDQVDRDSRIFNVVTSVRATFAPYLVDVVTERPVSGPYDMVVYGGDSTEVGLPAGIGGVVTVDCLNANPSNVILIFGDSFVDGSDEQVATLTVAGTGMANGIPSSSEVNDCMCWGAPGCPGMDRCTIGGAGTPLWNDDPCRDGATTVDVQARFAMTFGLRP